MNSGFGEATDEQPGASQDAMERHIQDAVGRRVRGLLMYGMLGVGGISGVGITGGAKWIDTQEEARTETLRSELQQIRENLIRYEAESKAEKAHSSEKIADLERRAADHEGRLRELERGRR